MQVNAGFPRRGDLFGIDIVKLIMSFAVIAIHAPEYLWPEDRTYSTLIDWFIRLAVPFFFITSGFLASKRLESLTSLVSKKKYLHARSVKLFRIWGLWLLIYLPLSVWGYLQSTEPINQKVIDYIKDVLLSGHSLYSHHLWFIYSLAIITWIWYLTINNLMRLWILFGFFVTISFLGWIVKDSSIPYNGVFNSFTTWVLGGGMPVLGGALFYCYRDKFSQLRNWCILTVCCIIGSLLSYCLKLPFWPVSGGLALFIIAYRLRPAWNLNYMVMRQESMWIYYLHMYVIMTVMVIIRQLHISLGKEVLFLIICAITWSLSRVIIRLCTLPKFKILEELIK